MEQQKVDMFIMANNSKLPSDNIYLIRDAILGVDDSKWAMLSSIELKNPTVSLIFSLFLGGLGIDRFYIGDVAMGLGKLITCGGFGFWTIIDWFLIMNTTKERNAEKLRNYLY